MSLGFISATPDSSLSDKAAEDDGSPFNLICWGEPPDKRLATPNPRSLPDASDTESKAGESSLLETAGTKLALLAVRELFCGLCQGTTGGEDDRADAARFRLLVPTPAGGLVVMLQLDNSQSLGTVALWITGDSLEATPEPDRGARTDVFNFALELGLVELNSSRTVALGIQKKMQRLNQLVSIIEYIYKKLSRQRRVKRKRKQRSSFKKYKGKVYN